MKFSANSLKKLVKGACYFETVRGYLISFKYSKAQLDLMNQEGYDEFWRVRGNISAGIRIEFITDSDFVSFDYKACLGSALSDRSNTLDAWIDGALYSVIHLESLKGNVKIDLPKGEKRVCIYLPCDSQLWIKNFTIEGRYKSVKDKGQKVLVIGDSITQGYGPTFSSGSYFNELQRQTGYNMLNQGIGGYRCEAKDLMYVEGFEPDKIVTFLGTNWYDAEDVYPYEKATADFYNRLTELYPNKQIMSISPLWRGDEGFNAERFKWCTDIVKNECKKHENITLVDGFTLLPGVFECFCDKLHPNEYGCKILATNIHKEMKKNKF